MYSSYDLKLDYDDGWVAVVNTGTKIALTVVASGTVTFTFAGEVFVVAMASTVASGTLVVVDGCTVSLHEYLLARKTAVVGMSKNVKAAKAMLYAGEDEVAASLLGVVDVQALGNVQYVA